MKSVEKNPDGLLTVHTTDGIIDKVNCLIWAVGRLPVTRGLNLNYVVCNSFILMLSLLFVSKWSSQKWRVSTGRENWWSRQCNCGWISEHVGKKYLRCRRLLWKSLVDTRLFLAQVHCLKRHLCVYSWDCFIFYCTVGSFRKHKKFFV